MLQKEAIKLLIVIADTSNVEAIIKRLLRYLIQMGNHSKEIELERQELVGKMIHLVDRFSRSKEWYLKTTNLILEHGGDSISC